MKVIPGPPKCSETQGPGLPGRAPLWLLGFLHCLMSAACSSRSAPGLATRGFASGEGDRWERDVGGGRKGLVLERHWERREAHATPAPRRQGEIQNKPSRTPKSELDSTRGLLAVRGQVSATFFSYH